MKAPKSGARAGSRAKGKGVAPQSEAESVRTHIGGVPIEFLNQVKPLFDKVHRGMNHHNPIIKAEWWRLFADTTPAEEYLHIAMMAEPPGKKGRPQKSGLEEQDLQLMPEVHRRVSAGETLKAVTEDLVELDRLQGGKPSLSAPVRIQRRYREWRKTQK
jgi:hypothetical protein